MIACDAARLIAYAALAALVATGHASIVVIIVAAVIDAIGGGLFSMAEMSAIRNLVAVEQVAGATARNEARSAGLRA